MIPWALALALVLLPELASACPACLGNQRAFTGPLKALAVMIVLPFFVAAVVYGVIRRATRDD